MPLARSLVRLHTPLIRFTYAIAKNGGKVHERPGIAPHTTTTTTTRTAASAAPDRIYFDSFASLPPHLRPHQFDEVEMETILMGGAAPYVPKALQAKLKAKKAK